MSLFSKNGDDKSDGSPVTPTVDSDVASRTAALEYFADKVLDTLAGMLRDYGRFGFDTEAMDSAELEHHCDAWARHILTGTPAPLQGEELVEQETVERVHLYDRSLPEMQRFFRGHRRDEQAAVLGSAKGMRSLISQMTNGLRSAIVEDGAGDERIRQEMVAVGKVMQGNSLEDIRARLGETIDLVSRVTMARQTRYEEQLQSMAENVRSLRADLLAVREKVNMDALTRLHNRGAFDEVLSKQVEYSFLSGQTSSLIILDLDYFKQINDTFGHQAGDLVLQVVANAIVRTFPRRSDFIARFGGEEFAVILSDAETADLGAIGDRLIEAVRALRIDYQGNILQITCSIGLTVCRPDDSPETVLNRADRALYHAKQAGRDRITIVGD